MISFTEKINFLAKGYIQLLLSYCQETGQNKKGDSWQGTEVSPAFPIAEQKL